VKRIRLLFEIVTIMCLVTAGLIMVPAAQAVTAVTITVNTTELTHNDNGNCDLLEALTAASANIGIDFCPAGGNVIPDIIAFNIGGGGAQTISPSVTIDVTSPVEIDGSTQPGYAGIPLIKITGSVAPVLQLSTGSQYSSIKALQLATTDTHETVEIYSDQATLTANYINTDGTSVLGTGESGVSLMGSDNSLIGGPLASDRNLFGGENGILIEGGLNTVVQGNYFGLTSTGSTLLAGMPVSTGNAVFVAWAEATSGTVIRGNVVSGGYDSGGILMGPYASDSVIAGNIIGLGADGVTRIGNTVGVYIVGASTTTIGGMDEVDRNVISGNYYNIKVNNSVGVVTIFALNNQILGNYIGTTADGMSRVTAWGDEGTDEYGVYLHSGDSTTIGGASAAHGNVIAGNDYGIFVDPGATATKILNNKIGTNKDGTAALRQEYGITALASVMIGDGVTPGHNVVSGNDVGIQVSGGVVASIFDNRIGLTADGNSPLGNIDGISLWSSAAVTIAGNWIAHNTDDGLVVRLSTLVLAGSTGNCFTSNHTSGAYSEVAATPLGSNWWGVPTGPTHAGNPGGTGDIVSSNVTYSSFLTRPPAACPRAESDFDGDGLTDIAKYTTSTHLLEYRRSSTEAWASQDMGVEVFNYVVRSDFDGDGMADPAKFITAANSLWYLKSSDNTWAGIYLGPGTYDYLPASDFDGDGYDDPATYAAGSNVLWYLESSSGSWQGEYLGPGTYTIVPGSDFDGDGITDPAHFNSSINALWYRGSSDATWHGVYLGPGTYSFVPGSDFDGDLLTDAAHFNSTSNALWYRKSSDLTWNSVYMGAGTLTYIPAGDFDGDELTDPAHFVAATNTGWALFSSDSTWYGMWLGPGTYTIVD